MVAEDPPAPDDAEIIRMVEDMVRPLAGQNAMDL